LTILTKNQKNNSMSTKSIISLVTLAVGAIIAIVVFSLLVSFKTIEGDEVAVKETWGEGVINEVFGPKTYMLFPAFTQKLFPYKINQQVYVMNDDPNDYAEGREKDSYLVQSSDQQDMRISLAVQWRRDPLKIVELHKTVKENVEERVLRPELQRIVKDKATVRTALQAYSGEGLVQLQNDILAALRDKDGELAERGVIVDNFVIQHIGLDPTYVKEITERQVAIQARLKNMEQTKAAEAAAEKAKAEARANYEKMVVEADRDKQVGILGAEKEAEQQVLAAEAAKKRVVLAAEGEKESGELRAQAIIAIGNAEAEAIKQKMLAYSSAGSENFVKMEVAKSMGEAYKNISGYLPSDMNIMLLSDKYKGAINLLADPTSN
jgi:regulator of protease activity HflC (stomatin/prohibitin superfamily)